MSRAPGPFIELRKYKDPFDHVRYRAFMQCKAQAMYRKEGFTMTADEFFELWTPENWARRGRKSDDLAMIRVDITKPWCLANCVLVTRYQQVCRGKKLIKYPDVKNKLCI